MQAALIVGFGSFLGGMARFLIQQFIQQKMATPFPYGTLIVNVTGCLLIGFIFSYGIKTSLSNEWRFFLMTGICGGYTTFSAFSIESIALFRSETWHLGLTYIIASVVLGVLATLLGMWVSKAF